MSEAHNTNNNQKEDGDVDNNSGELVINKSLSPTVNNGSLTMEHLRIGTHEQNFKLADTINVYPNSGATMSRDIGAGGIYDYKFKILIIGDSGVGKTSLMFRYTDDTFSPQYFTTIAVDFMVKTITWQDKRIKLQLWDTVGQERFQSIIRTYYRGASGIILVYDVTNSESFSNITTWYHHAVDYAPDDVQMILVGNKVDMEDERIISTENGSNLAQRLILEFFETSAKENVCVKLLFKRLVDILCDKAEESRLARDSRSTNFADLPIVLPPGNNTSALFSMGSPACALLHC